MMIEHTAGNILFSDAHALVNPVNCVGVMGAGLAEQFKRAYPQNYEAYKRLARNGHIRPGNVYVYDVGPKYIINFPTKRHWRDASRIEDIDAGLSDLVKQISSRRIASIAIPPLGCGLGGLDWDVVRPRIELACATLRNVRFLIYGPLEHNPLQG